MMNQEPFGFCRQYGRYILFYVSFLLGLFAGILYIARYPFSSLMRFAVYPQMSIVFGLLSSALPFVVLYIFFRCSAFWLVLPFAFFRAFTFMYCFGGITIAFAEAGWLVRFLLLFSDSVSVPLLLWYAGGELLEKAKCSNYKIWVCLLCLIVVRCIDSYVISPFASELLIF